MTVVKQDNGYYMWNLKRHLYEILILHSKYQLKNQKNPSWSGYFPTTITSSPVPLVLCNTGSHRARCCLRRAEGRFLFYGSHSESTTILLSQEYSVLQSLYWETSTHLSVAGQAGTSWNNYPT